MTIKLDSTYTQSPNVVAREIADEIIIVPLLAGIGDMEDELFTLNDSARAIWNRLDSSKKLKDIVNELALDFNENTMIIQEDVLGLIRELYKRGIVIEHSE